MVRLAVADAPGYEVSDVELNRPGASYTIITVETLRDLHHGADLYWLISHVSESARTVGVIAETRAASSNSFVTLIRGPPPVGHSFYRGAGCPVCA